MTHLQKLAERAFMALRERERDLEQKKVADRPAANNDKTEAGSYKMRLCRSIGGGCKSSMFHHQAGSQMG